MSQARAIAYAATIHKRLCNDLGIRETTKDIQMVAGQMDYALGSEVVNIFAAVYYTSATELTPLTVTSFEKEDLDDESWREETLRDGTPNRYLVRSAKAASGTGDTLSLTLLPTPDTDFDTDYPIVRLWVTSHAAFSATTDVLPESLLDERVYVNGVRMLFAEDNALEVAPFYREAYERDLDVVKAWYRNLTFNDEAMRLRMPHYSGRASV